MKSNRDLIDKSFTSNKFKKHQLDLDGKILTLEDMLYIVDRKEIKEVKDLAFCNISNYIAECRIGSHAVKELVSGQWLSLEKLSICKNIFKKL